VYNVPGTASSSGFVAVWVVLVMRMLHRWSVSVDYIRNAPSSSRVYVARVPWVKMNLGSGVFLVRLCHTRSVA